MALFTPDILRNHPDIKRKPKDASGWDRFIKALNSGNLSMSGQSITELGDIAADPDSDAILFWDDSETGSEGTWITQIPDSFITESSITQHEAALSIAESQITDGSILARLAANETITGQWTFEGRVDIDTGNSLRIQDSTDTDYIQISHDGSNANFTFVNTGALDIENVQLRLLGGGAFSIFDSSGADSVSVQHDGTDFNFTGANTANVDFANVSGVRVRDGAYLRIQDSADTDYLQLDHTGDHGRLVTNVGDIINLSTDLGGYRFYAASGTEYVRINHGGTNAGIGTTTGALQINTASNLTQFIGGEAVRIYDSGNTDYVGISHDGTDAIRSFVNTANYDIDPGAALSGTMRFQGRAIASSSGTTGGTGSAGAGNEYVELNINGTTYRVLHDGTV